MDTHSRPLALVPEAAVSAADRRSLAIDVVWHDGWIPAPEVDEAPARSLTNLGNWSPGSVKPLDE